MTFKEWLNLDPPYKHWLEEVFDVERKAGEEFEAEHPPPEESNDHQSR